MLVLTMGAKARWKRGMKTTQAAENSERLISHISSIWHDTVGAE